MSALVEHTHTFVDHLKQIGPYVWLAALMIGLSIWIQFFTQKYNWRWSSFARTSWLPLDLITLAVATSLLGPPATRFFNGSFLSTFLACDLTAMLIAAVCIAGATVVWVFKNEISLHALALLASRLLLLILIFASAYRIVGITGPGGRAYGLGACFYFSLVTITTIGYGDFFPLPQARVFVSFEALIGWLYMGLFIAALTNYLNRKNP